MEKEILFTTSKWEIIKVISEEPRAPLGIAKILNTTIANVSQQLRLLEASGLVKKQRLANVEAGKPRALFSLSNDIVFLSLASSGLAKKKIIDISPIQVIISRIWLLDNFDLSDVLSKFVYENDSIFLNNSVCYKNSSSSKINLEILSNKSNVETKEIFWNNKKYQIELNYVSKFSNNVEVLINEN